MKLQNIMYFSIYTKNNHVYYPRKKHRYFGLLSNDNQN